MTGRTADVSAVVLQGRPHYECKGGFTVQSESPGVREVAYGDSY